MDLKEIKKLMGESGRCVIVENDKPAYIVMTAKEFLALPENKVAEPALKFDDGEKQPAVELPVVKESRASFVNFEDAGEALGLQDITFEDLGIDELPD